MPASAAASEPVRHKVVVDADPVRAFDAFLLLHRWWPREYSWAADALEMIAVEPRVGGRCYERGPHGFECDWGRVVAYEPPRRLVFTWQINFDRTPQPDPAKASEVEVRFTARGVSTMVQLEHRGFERHGERALDYRAGMESKAGWPLMLERYAASIRRVLD